MDVLKRHLRHGRQSVNFLHLEEFEYIGEEVKRE